MPLPIRDYASVGPLRPSVDHAKFGAVFERHAFRLPRAACRLSLLTGALRQFQQTPQRFIWLFIEAPTLGLDQLMNIEVDLDGAHIFPSIPNPSLEE